MQLLQQNNHNSKLLMLFKNLSKSSNNKSILYKTGLRKNPKKILKMKHKRRRICLWESSKRLLKALSMHLLIKSMVRFLENWYILYKNKMKKNRKRKKNRRTNLYRTITFILWKTNKQIMTIALSFSSSQIKRSTSQIITCCLRKVRMVKINKSFQATLEILSLRLVITKDSNRSNLHNKLNNKFRVSSKRRSGKFRKREDCMLHALVIHRKIQCLTNQAFQVKLMSIIIVLLYSKVYLHHKLQIMEERSITKSRTLWTVTI